MISVKHILFVLPLVLVGCGGGGSEPPIPTPEPEVTPPVTPPPVNSAPQATDDFAVSEDNNAVSIEVLVNDSDQDGDDLSIQSILNEPLNGTVSIEDDVIVYTPNSFYAGADSFSYQISDGELTSEANVTLQVTQSITVNGIVTDSPVSGATVTVNLSSGQFIAVADEQGAYSLDLVLSNLTDVVTLNAVGSEENNQASVELASFLGNTQELLSLGSEQRVVGADTLFATNITNVSTATLLLVQEANAGALPSTLDAFSLTMESVNAQALLELAAFINILVDNPNFVVPEGQTSLSIFQSEEGQTIRVAIDTYLASVGALDEENGPSSVYLEAESEAIDTIVQSSSLLPSFDIEDVRQSNLVATFGNVFPGFLPETGSVYQLNSNGDGLFYSGVDIALSNNFSSAFNWGIENGRIQVVFSDSFEGELPSSVRAFTLSEVMEVFGEQAEESALEALDSFDTVPVRLSLTPVSAQIIPINLGETIAQVRIITTSRVFGTIGESTFESIELSSDSENINLYLSPDSLFRGSTSSVLRGRWVMPLEYTYTPQLDGTTSVNSVNGIFADVIDLMNGGSASASVSSTDFSWRVTTQGDIELTRGATQYLVRPIIENQIEFLAQVTKTVDGDVENVFVAKIARFVDDFVLTEDYLISELPIVQANFGVFGFDASNWNNEQWMFERIFQEPVFNSNNEATLYNNVRSPEGDFFAPSTPDNRITVWNLLDGVFNYRTRFSNNTFTFSEDIQWIPIGVNEDGWLYVFQLRSFFGELNSDSNGVFDVGDFSAGVDDPRIEIIIPLDLSTYEEEYERSVLMGTVPPLP